MKKRLKIKWKNIIAGLLIIDIIRTFCILAFNVTASLTWLGLIVLACEICVAGVITE